MTKYQLLIICAFALCLTSCVRQPDFPKLKIGKIYHSEFDFDCEGHHFHIPFDFPDTTYHYYNSIPKNLPYETYTCEDAGHVYMEYVVGQLDAAIAPYRFDDRQKAEFILRFAQSIHYEPDPPGPEYSRFPILTILEKEADCEDYALLISTLSSYMGLNASLIDIVGAGHMAAGIELPNECGYDRYVSPTGHRYVYAEGTNPNIPLGYICHPKNRVRLIEIPALHGNQGRQLVMAQYLPQPVPEPAPRVPDPLSGDDFLAAVIDKLAESYLSDLRIRP